MSDFEKDCPLAMAKQWEHVNGLNNPVAVNNKGFKQPDRIDIRRAPEIVGGREQRAKVVPNQAEQGIEWAIVYLHYPTVFKQLCYRMEVDADASPRKRHIQAFH